VLVIENIANTLGFVFRDILKCPLMLEVLALIVVMKFEMSFEASSSSCRNNWVAEESVVLLNLATPADIPVEFVVVE
jgi:hypothetical protein